MVARVTVLSVVDAIADDLRNEILRGELVPGDPLTEAEVSESYDVARATAKAAIERLVAESVLERRTHKTARVVKLGPDEVRDIYRARAYLEAEVLRQLAAARTVPDDAVAANAEFERLGDVSSFEIIGPDMHFHTALVDALGNTRTSRMYRTLVSEVTLCLAQVHGRQLVKPTLLHAEHAEILTRLRAGDADGATLLLAEHLGRARERLAEALGGQAGPEATTPSSLGLAD